jgi:glyoxylase-like metal-dependent hydrolase (beta-lactamase superfamily II)
MNVSAREGGRIAEILPDAFRITLPLPGARPGPVNVYLFTGDNAALVDTGTKRTVHILERALRGLDVSCSSLKSVVITHGHIEHCGAARLIVRASGGAALVAAHEEDRRPIEHALEADRARYLGFYRLMGVPLRYRLSLAAMELIFHAFADNCRVDRVLRDGDRLDLGRYEATVVATPGHTRGSVCLFIEKEGVLFSGDHVLGHITPNAFAMIEDGVDLPRRLSQVEFFDSLRIVEELDPRIVYPAHGGPVENLRGTVAIYRDQFEQRQRGILSIIGSEALTAYDIGRRLFPGIKGFRAPLEIFLAVSEVFTHLQVLERDGRVTAERRRGVIGYSRRDIGR